MKLNAELLRISPGVVAIFAVVSTLAVPLALAQPQLSLNDFLAQLVVGLIITAISILALFMLLLVRQLPTTMKLATWLLILVAIGAGRGYLLATLAQQFGFTDPAPLAVRIINSIVTTMLWVTLSAIFIELARSFRVNYQKQISVLFLKQAAAQAELNKDFSLLTSRSAQLQQVIEDLQAAKLVNLTASSQYQDLITQVRAQVSEVLRPLSHRLYSSDVLIAPRIRFFRTLRFSISGLSFSIPIVLTMLVFTGFINGLAIFGFVIALLRLFLVVALWLLIHWLWQQQKLFSKLSHTTRNVSYLVAAGVAPIMFSEAVNDFFNLDHNYFVALLLSPLLPALIVLTSFIEFFQQDRDQIILRLSKISQENQVSNDSVNLDRKQIASYLHNSLQSELVGISMQLAAAATAADEAAAKAAMERLHATLTRSIQTGFQQLADSPAARLEKVTHSWAGIAEINLLLTDFDDLSLPDQTNLVQLCEELISNSVRLGRATQIQVSGNLANHAYLLHLETNGKYSADYVAGMGSNWIDDITDGNWQISPTSNGVYASAKLNLTSS